MKRLLLLLLLAPSVSAEPLQPQATRAFIDTMVTQHGFERAYLVSLFGGLSVMPEVLQAFVRPAERRSWKEYRGIFLTRDRVVQGRDFLHRHRETLQRAEHTYGVPAVIITAILGVETHYGRITGRHPVLSALATLAFHGERRRDFFRGELEQFLLLARELQLDPLAMRGSYAGAMGLPQFISSSYRRYAIDFDGDGKADIWNNPTDAIGSIAHYLSSHGWVAGAPIVVQVQRRPSGVAPPPFNELKPNVSMQRAQSAGFIVPDGMQADQQVTLLQFDAGSGEPEYWLGFDNFYMITRYNHSHFYAMAVYQLGRMIDADALRLGVMGLLP